MKKIAVEEHFLTAKYIEFMRNRKDFPRREVIEEGGRQIERQWTSANNFRVMQAGEEDRIVDFKLRLNEMDEAGIDMQVLSLSFPSVEFFSPGEAVTAAMTVNDEIAGIVARYPKRFASFAVVAPQDPEAACRELERAVKTLGLKGTLITGNIGGEYLDNRKFWPLLETAEKLDVPVYIHPKFPHPDMIKPYIAYPGLSSAMLGYGHDASLHAMRLIMSGVFDKYPGLKIMLGHMGEALPFWLWRIDAKWESTRVADVEAEKLYGTFKKKPSQYIRDNFYVTTSGMFWHPPLKYICEVMGADHVLFAVDYPYESSKLGAEFMESAPLSKADREKVSYKNAEKIFKIG